MNADKIKFGTDGWRAIIAQDFTVYNVARVSQALADWLNEKGQNAKVVVGHDCVPLSRARCGCSIRFIE